MSWHFSRALVEAFSEACSSDGARSVPWSSIPFAPDDSCSAKMKDTFHRSPSGMMFAPSTDTHGEALLTWFRGAFLARTSALQVEAQESTASAAGSGPSLLASFVKYDRDSHSWKTRQLSLLEDSAACSVTWPRWGRMRDGACYPLRPSALHTSESGSGLLPTLTAQSYGSNKGGSAGRVGKERLSLHALSARGRLPTLTVSGNYNRAGASAKRGGGLATVLGGPLSPSWCEWFMGWPVGWTGLEPLATDKFRQWLLGHGERSPKRSSDT
jgi:hypothetical protein